MNLSTRYLGLTLRNPVVIGASPCCDDLDVCRRLEGAGAAALVMHSLFGEQVEIEEDARLRLLDGVVGAHSEASGYFPHLDDYALTPDLYLRQLARLKSVLKIPVIASLNCARPGSWIDHARRLESAGADALELNLYSLATDSQLNAADMEAGQLFIVREVVRTVGIPVAVKLSPWYTAPANFIHELELAGAKGVVLFNRLYQPDLSIDDFEVLPQLRLSDSSELPLRLRWLAILSPQTRLSLAAGGGIHSSADLVKCLLAGAHAAQLVSVVLRHGPAVLRTLLEGLQAWMRARDYASVEEMRGALNLARCPDPAAHERANYLDVLQSWRM